MLCSMSIVLYIVDYLPKGVCTVFVNASAQIKMRQRSEMHHFYLIFLYKNNREDAAGWVLEEPGLGVALPVVDLAHEPLGVRLHSHRVDHDVITELEC